jgi:hypothetical protein
MGRVAGPSPVSKSDDHREWVKIKDIPFCVH